MIDISILLFRVGVTGSTDILAALDSRGTPVLALIFDGLPNAACTLGESAYNCPLSTRRNTVFSL
jgi:hypothetical protein